MRYKRQTLIEKRFNKIVQIFQIETQDLRIKLIKELEVLFKHAVMMAKTAENRDDWMKIAGYIAQVINSLAKAYDETKFNEDIQRLREMIRRAKEKLAGQAGEGTPVA